MREKIKPLHQQTNQKPVPENRENSKASHEENKLIHIDHRLVTAEEKIHQLKKQREKLQFQQALLFFKETQKIFDKAFVPDLALFVLKDAWGKASEMQKEKWQKDRGQERRNKNISDPSEAGHPFRDFVASSSRETDPSPESNHHPS